MENPDADRNCHFIRLKPYSIREILTEVAERFETWGDSPINMTGVLVGNFEKNPKKVPESRLVGVAQINFHPQEVPGVLLEKPIFHINDNLQNKYQQKRA